VAVGADAGVGIGDDIAVRILGRPDGLRDIFQIDLMADAGAGGDRVEIGEGLAAPFQKVVALHVALIFNLDILLERLGRAEFVDHDAVVDDEVDRHLRVDLAGVGAQRIHRVAHGGEIDDAGDAGEILKQDAGGTILNLALGLALVILPVDDGLNILDRDGDAIFEAEQVFEQHLHREGQARHVAQLRRRFFERVKGDVLALDMQNVARAQCVLSDGGHENASPRGSIGPVGRMTHDPPKSRTA